MRRGIAHIAGRRILNVERAPCSRRPIEILPRIDVFRRRVQGQVIREVGRLGKRVVCWYWKMSNGLSSNRA
ncbi:MAG: hypothetical protein SGJ20_15735 [Planctomycetota bacterium]|nr:hypothetical protein [Planctomycetota bacterium]